jgi:hypothetical protein
MQFITGYNRKQTTSGTLEEQEEADNPVRLMNGYCKKQVPC